MKREPIGARAPESRGASLGAAAVIIVCLGTTYSLTLLPGIGSGDTSELQYMSAVLGLCHAPGYAIEIVFGKLFSLLPFGPDVAWRVNFMMAVSGVVGALAVFGTLRLATGDVVAGTLAALVLGWSSVYWHYSLVAEAYVFHTAFLLVGMYCAARFVGSDRLLWLLAAAACIGVAAAGRPSELIVLPGFVGLWLGTGGRARLDLRRVAAAALLFAAPFAFSIGYYLARDNPSVLFVRDTVFLRSFDPLPTMSELEVSGKPSLKKALSYSFASYWAGRAVAGTTTAQLEVGLSRYGRLLSGVAIAAGEGPPATLAIRESGAFGTSIGLTGLLLALLGIYFHRSRWGWPALGLAFFGGNLVFYLFHNRWDGLTFTAPGLAGLAFLAGLGMAPRAKGGWLRTVLRGVGALTAALLLVGNYRLVDRSQPDTLSMPNLSAADAATLPPRSIMLLTHTPANAVRYAAFLAGRPDIRVLIDGTERWPALVEALRRADDPVFIYNGLPTPATPRNIAAYGFSLVHPGR